MYRNVYLNINTGMYARALEGKYFKLIDAIAP